MLRSLRRQPRDRGAVAVEMALVLPILVVLVFGIINFGFVMAQQLALGNGARQAARYGVVANRTCGDMVSEVQENSSTVAMAGTDVSVTVSLDGSPICGPMTSPSSAGSSVIPCSRTTSIDSEVTVETKYTSSLVIPFAVYDPTFDLTSHGVFRCEFTG